jgi:hypothetical protein
MLSSYLDTDLDDINRYYRYKMINIITVPTIYSPVDVSIVPKLFSGIFLRATEVGIWILSTNENKNKRNFFYHDKIIKIEEVDFIDINSLEKNQKEIIESNIKTYEDNRQKEIKEIQKNITNSPDVIDPTDYNKVNEMINKVSQMVLEKKKKDEENFLSR